MASTDAKPVDEVGIPEGDYILTDGSAWFSAGPGFAVGPHLSIRLNAVDTDLDCPAGFEINVYKRGNEDGEPIASLRIIEVDDGVFVGF